MSTLGAAAECKSDAFKVEIVDKNLDGAKTDAARERWWTSPRLCDDAVRAEAKSQLQSLKKELAAFERSGAQGEVYGHCGDWCVMVMVMGVFRSGHVGVCDGCV